jgi:DNA processing protein
LPNAIVADPKPSSSNANSNQISWLALTLTPGLGPTRAKRLVEFFGSIEAVFNASLTELEAAGLPAAAAQSLGTGRSVELAHEENAKAVAGGIQIVPLDDPLYPPRLRQIYDPPLALYVRGNVAALSLPGIAMVGTRHPTPYGTGMAERLGCDLATRGLVIFSGLARGVDTASHRGVIAGKGKTVAVLGTGLDVIYPKENSRLCDQILNFGGALIFRVPAGNIRSATKFSDSQPNHQRHFLWSACRGSRRIQRHADHRPLRA